MKMTVSEEKCSYKEIEPLTDNVNGPVLVRKKESKEFFVKKVYSAALNEHLIILQQIKNKHLPKIQELQLQGDEIWLYEEFIHGKTLSELLQTSGLTTRDILMMALDLLDALMMLHEKGLVHRDIKPGNIMLSSDGVLKLIDFDAVRVFDGEKETDTIQLGTIGFASPEQFGFAQSDERSDLYSLGVVMNICSNREYPKDQLTTDPYLSGIIARATKLDPNDRYQSAVKMAQAIKENLRRLEQKLEYEKTTKPKFWQEIPSAAAGATIKNKQPKGQSVGISPVFQSIVLRHIPGFRTNQSWKKVIACIYYLFLALGLPIEVSSGKTWSEQLALALNVFVLLILPVLLFTNVGNFHAKVPLLKSKYRFVRLIGFGLLVLGWLYCYSIVDKMTGGLNS